ncbi:DUF481 domain-containing protein [Roseateles sp. DAIF2]|uniref:DUF481 domain-containing protein n=1 Tax=Roseateles sp. DAIF2 TaxID=2714952 RepID=UPI0018A322AC|nr:DUF481 domain-containing protein [Roseateles sp. DAIF2]QPF74750.1 DUF481 domain-containing protein [Roseateles sp. DAIF2]
MSGLASAQIAMEPARVPAPARPAELTRDGAIRATVGLAASLASGNSSASNLNLNADLVRATDTDKVSLYGRVQRAKANRATTDEQLRAGLRYDHDLSPRTFVYVGGELEHNRLANLDHRRQFGGGLGYHLIRNEAHSFDLFGGLSHTRDKYLNPALIDGEVRDAFAYASVMLGQESTHQISPSTSAKQRLMLQPNLKSRGEYRANWDADIAVAINSTLSLTVGVAVTHNSEPSPGRKPTDTLLTTGIAVKFD